MPEVDVGAVLELGGGPGGHLLTGQCHRQASCSVTVRALDALRRGLLGGQRQRRAGRRCPAGGPRRGRARRARRAPRPRRSSTRPAIAHSGLKLRVDLLKTRLPCRSPFQARTRAKSVTMACSRTYSRGSPVMSKSRVSLAGEPTATRAVRRRTATAARPRRPGCPTPVGGVEGRDTGPAGAQPFGEGALRGQLDLELALEVLAGELLVLPDVGGDHPADLLGLEEDAQPPVVDAAVVRDDLEVGDAALVQLGDENGGDAAQAETADGERGAVRDALDGLGGAGDDFVHAEHCIRRLSGHPFGWSLSPLVRGAGDYTAVIRRNRLQGAGTREIKGRLM